MRFILHIGDGKCGSSSIQYSLKAAQKQLEKHRVVYQTSGDQDSHFNLVTLVGGSTRGDDNKQRRLAEATISKLKSASAKADYILLSAENFLQFGPKRVHQILDLISPLITSIDVIAYVREPVGMYLSIVQQALKGNHVFPHPNSYTRDLATPLLSWKTADGVRSITVHSFDKKTLIGGSSVTDFAHVLETIIGSKINLSDFHKNTSISSEQIILLNRFKREIEIHLSGKRTVSSNRLIDLFEKINREKFIGCKPELKTAVSRLIMERNKGNMQRLTEAFPNLFFSSLDTTESESEPDLMNVKINSVATILEKFDVSTVSALAEFVPPLSDQIRSYKFEQSENAILFLNRKYGIDMTRLRQIIGEYWEAEGIHSVHINVKEFARQKILLRPFSDSEISKLAAFLMEEDEIPSNSYDCVENYRKRAARLLSETRALYRFNSDDNAK